MSLIETINNTFDITAIAEECSVNGIDIGTDSELGAAVIATTFKGAEHATCVIHNLYRGNCSADDIQAILDIAYPGCTKRTASHHLCRFRNPSKYEPKHTPRYAVTGGRGGRINNANIGDIGKDLAARLKALTGR